ncbi:DnaA N-terminal domain-containing protein [Clostridium tarantellae]|uniref:DnaA N-terminal domain-containing protein n=1 Tax=Clostridium tarantellae TaxID=39493 RepID=A0A6I1MK06_9CLOT|nr:DnaA N-terminal domain-containing protein [Clostridium tarantellae]MPQ43284.1 hypothetical protein [Clostridium tarantellae]
MNNLWDKALEIVNGEISDISFNNWIKEITPIEITTDTIIAIAPNHHIFKDANKRYKDLLELAFKISSGKNYKLILKNDIQINNKEIKLCTKSNVKKELIELKSEIKNIEKKIDILVNELNEES